MKGLYALKPWYTRRLGRIVDASVRAGLSPDVFTAVGIAAGVLAGVCIWRGWWVAAGLALAARLGGANLDGAVARARGVSRPWGFVLNELGDRTSDVAMFAGLAALAVAQPGPAHAALRSPGLEVLSTPVVAVLIAAMFATLPTFASLAAAGAGATRRNGGPLGKTERCALAVLATALPGWLVPVSAVVAAGSLLTAAIRLAGTHRELSSSAPRPDASPGPVAA